MSVGSTSGPPGTRLADGLDIEHVMAEQFGGVPSLDHYRQVYSSCGVPWPGDDEIRRQLPAAAES